MEHTEKIFFDALQLHQPTLMRSLWNPYFITEDIADEARREALAEKLRAVVRDAYAHLDAECSGEGPVPYVILAGVADGSNDARLRMNTWVQANGTPVATFDGGTYTAEIYAVDRPAAVAPTPDAGAEPSGLR
jgi:hypothetical protein